MQRVVVCNLGLVDYAPTWELQRRIQGELIDAKRAEPRQELPHVMLLVEHPPVFTLGKSGDRGNLLASDDVLRERGAEFFHIDRGGDITFHGPGQIVGYPILDLGRFYTDIHRYLRDLEETIIGTCADYDVEARRVTGRTGVWVGEEGNERKICAMGIRCSRWVTMHGFALNVNTNLDYFNFIVPCGISDRSVTSLSQETGRTIPLQDVQERLLEHFQNRFGVATTVLDSDEARSYAEEFAGINTGG